MKAVHHYNSLDPSQLLDGPEVLDTAWVDEMELKNSREKNKLEAELGTYTRNMIKESIRVRLLKISRLSCNKG